MPLDEREIVDTILELFHPEDRVVSVVGSRRYGRPGAIARDVRRLTTSRQHGPGTVVCSGTRPDDADGRAAGWAEPGQGADQVALREAERCGLATLCWVAPWDDLEAPDAVVRSRRGGQKYNANAVLARNIDIVRVADDVMAYWDLKSRGTAHSVLLAVSEDKLRLVRDPSGEKVDPLDAAITAEEIRG